MNTSDPRLNRRYFLKTSGLALAGASSGMGRLSAAVQKRPGMKKALMFGMVKTEGTLLEKFRMPRHPAQAARPGLRRRGTRQPRVRRQRSAEGSG